MNSLLSDSISEQEQKEFERLRRRSWGGVLRLAFVAVIVLTAITVIIFSIHSGRGSITALRAARANPHRIESAWLADFVDRQTAYRDWLNERGLRFEHELFDEASEIIYYSASDVLQAQSESRVSFLSKAYLTLLFGIMRICFVAIACARLWLVVIAVALYRGLRSLRVHSAPDFLGLLGNGRLYYSGIRAEVKGLAANKAPDLHVRGLACPKVAPRPLVERSSLFRVLRRHNAVNETNLTLSGILLQYERWPAYLPEYGEDALLEQAFSGGKLGEAAPLLLDAALELHHSYRRGEKLDDASGNQNRGSLASDGQGKMSLPQYIERLTLVLHRVLTPQQRRRLAEMTPQELATIVLAHEAGKVLSYAEEAGRWVKKSTFNQLSARAVLHSLPSFATDYATANRAIIRRSLVYGSRRSVYAPVRFPVDLCPQTYAARQWVEVLLAAPHELAAVADEVELFGMVVEGNKAFAQVFADSVIKLNQQVVESVLCDAGQLFFMPLPTIMKLVRGVLSEGTIRRCEELVALVSQKQRLQTMSADLAGEGAARPAALYERIFAPLSFPEMKRLSDEHGVPFNDVRDWSALRIIFNTSGWLGRRIGDHTVPDASVVFTVFESETPSREANEHGRIGRKGMVAFRGSRLEERWGSSWASRFTQMGVARMAETTEQFERLMRGEEEQPAQEAGDVTPPTTAAG